MDTDDLIASQIGYYRARATRYDRELPRAAEEEAWDEFAPRFGADVAELDRWLEADPPTGHVLEIAAGSGNRTTQLLRTADRVTALDAAPEMLELLAVKHPQVERIEADIFTWESPHRYDNVFFGYWISHIPAARWARFWQTVARSLAPGGRVWFMDNAHPGHANTRGPGDWPVAAGLREVDSIDTEVRVRKLWDGREWAMVKRYWWPEELEADLARLGWQAEVHHTDFAFIYGTADPSPASGGG
jgi:demethylmenaquinone methyltransferase/2-methoxy-6-polyprenyl-1,4-benzoquinol methylase